ncbi:Tht1-like nuclear fusion protein-domain-containing protein [Gongronella butleri]|nr:Tht1-like nuclear fusion protein-domain-containing protein [Gongronella butleri]
MGTQDVVRNEALFMPQRIVDHAIAILHDMQVKKGNCFQAIVTTMDTDCDALLENDQARMKLAVQLTLCELSMSYVSAPRQCAPRLPIHTCVHTLASSPQLWTTYSGYLRESIHICFMLRYPMEKDLLAQVQANMTREQTQNYALLHDQQQQLVQWRQEEVSQLKNLGLQHASLMERIVGAQNKSFAELDHLATMLQTMTSEMYAFHQQTKSTQEQWLENWAKAFDDAEQLVSPLLDSLQSLALWQDESLTHWQVWMARQQAALDTWDVALDGFNATLHTTLGQMHTKVNDLQHDMDGVLSRVSAFIHVFARIRQFAQKRLAMLGWAACLLSEITARSVARLALPWPLHHILQVFLAWLGFDSLWMMVVTMTMAAVAGRWAKWRSDRNVSQVTRATAASSDRMPPFKDARDTERLQLYLQWLNGDD